MSQENLALAANPAIINAINTAGGSVPSLASAVAAASAKEMDDIIKSATETATLVLQSATAQTTQFVNEEIDLTNRLAAVDKKKAELARARRYFEATNNIFPMQKLLGIPTKAVILGRYPDIEKIPSDWAPPAATQGTVTTAA